ncbi:MAG: thymidine phosphorylase [Planctomycetota bacterium]|nr:thymidine phosphorylase [Planctomycetota bacterium]
MRAVDLIRKKRDNGELSHSEIAFLVEGISNGQVLEYQWSAMLMAIIWRGMTDSETAALCNSMMKSGEIVDLSMIPGPKVDKHSTGGIGDKTSLILAPIAAAAGVNVPMVSGRGLGHTGGTLDKLESIPGFNVNLNLNQYRDVLARCRMVLIGQTPQIAPADKFLYALRDATATVESIPLIASSIMSKKLAEGIDGLVLDVKTGHGAFMPDEKNARKLAVTMIDIAKNLGKKCIALLTNMEQPLGRMAGNSLEIYECMETLKGRGATDLTSLSIELAAEMIVMAGISKTMPDARLLAQSTIDNGSALDHFRQTIAAQGGNPSVCDDPLGILPMARRQIPILANADGWISSIKARDIGQSIMLLGAGREHVASQIDYAVGSEFLKKVGDPVKAGETIAILHVNHETRLTQAKDLFQQAISISQQTGAKPLPVILDRIT